MHSICTSTEDAHVADFRDELVDLVQDRSRAE